MSISKNLVRIRRTHLCDERDPAAEFPVNFRIEVRSVLNLSIINDRYLQLNKHEFCHQHSLKICDSEFYKSGAVNVNRLRNRRIFL